MGGESSVPEKPFLKTSCIHFSCSSLPNFASIVACSTSLQADITECSWCKCAINMGIGNEHHKKWFKACTAPESLPFEEAEYKLISNSPPATSNKLVQQSKKKKKKKKKKRWIPEQSHYWFKAQNRRAGNLKTWWICALCTRSFGKRGLLSGNLSSKYCKAPLHPCHRL